MDLETLHLFVEVAQRGSFAAVARDRDLDPSAVSRSVAALEDALGVRLLQRSTRRMSLTDAGARYLARLTPALQDLARAQDEAQGDAAADAGSLRLTASMTLGHLRLVPLLPKWRAAFPRMRLELLLTDTNLDLVADRVDLAIRLGATFPYDLVGVKLFDTAYRVCASAAYLADSPPLTAPADLARHRCLLLNLPEFRARWRFRRPGGAVTEVAMDGDLLISSALALRHCALAGMGLVMLPNWVVDPDIAAGRLVQVLADWQATATGFDTAAWLLYSSRTHLPAKLRAAIDFLRRHLR